MRDDQLRETTVASRLIHTGSYLTVRVDTVRDADGREHQRDVVDHPGAVAILALVGPQVLMVRQYRTPAGRVLLEIPAGTLERHADGSVEDPAAAASRELAEETGYRAADQRLLASFYTAPGFASEHMRLFLATGLSAIGGYDGPGPEERLALDHVPWRDAVASALRGDIADAKTLVALLWLDRLVAAGEIDPDTPTGH